MKKLLLACALVLVAGCKQKPGDVCNGDKSMCGSKTSALVCRGGKLAEVPCAGPLACVTVKDRANCDDSVATDGDLCMGNGVDDEYACSADKKRALTCKGGKFERYLECRGKGGCSLLGAQISCDTSLSQKGDPCKTPNASACAVDGKTMLICRDNKFDTHRYCRGKLGCYLNGDVPSCDMTISLPGDPCTVQGYAVCSADGLSELVCQGGQYLVNRACHKGGCTVTNVPGHIIDCP